MGAVMGSDDRSYMMRAIALAERAVGYTAPNPMVGCVIVKDGRIVGEGFHARPGAAHAEPVALRAAGAEAKGATCYVTLEPCNHTGRTGPCTEALIEAGVARVVYAVADPNPLAAGGADRLDAAGISVEAGLCEAEARHLARFWLHAQATGTPYVIAKYAATLDGRIATRTGESKWITSEAARIRAHDLRQACDAIIVGAETVLKDDPSLTARPHLPAGRRDAAHPLRIILDSKGRVPVDARVFRSTTPGKAMVVTTDAMPMLKQKALANRNVELLKLRADETGRPDLTALMATLGARGLLSVMVEGGGTVLGRFFDLGLVDEVWAFIAPVVLGGGRAAIAGTGAARMADAWRLDDPATEHHDGTILVRGRLAGQKAAAPGLTPRLKEASCSQVS